MASARVRPGSAGTLGLPHSLSLLSRHGVGLLVVGQACIQVFLLNIQAIGAEG